jgi:hypothetical protein
MMSRALPRGDLCHPTRRCSIVLAGGEGARESLRNAGLWRRRHKSKALAFLSSTAPPKR